MHLQEKTVLTLTLGQRSHKILPSALYIIFVCDEGTNLRLRDFAGVPLMPTRDWGCGPYKICTNDKSRLTLTYFMARSNSIPNAFI